MNSRMGVICAQSRNPGGMNVTLAVDIDPVDLM